MADGVRVEPPEQRPLPLPRQKREDGTGAGTVPPAPAHRLPGPLGVTPLPLPKPGRRRAGSPVEAAGGGRSVEGSPEGGARKVTPNGGGPAVRIAARSHSDPRRVPRLAGQGGGAGRGTGTYHAPRVGGRRVGLHTGAGAAPHSGTQRRPLTQRAVPTTTLASTRSISSGTGGTASARLTPGAGTARLRSNSSGAVGAGGRRQSGPRTAKRRSATPPPMPVLAEDEEEVAVAQAPTPAVESSARNRPPGGSRRRASSPPAAGRKRVPWGNRFIAALPLPPRHTGKKWTVVLDLDQTLVNAHGDDVVVQRPGLLAMLERLGDMGAERVLWTASNEAQVKFVLRRIGASGQLFEYVVSWDTLGWTRPGIDVSYYKDLAKLRRPLATTILVDNDVRMVRVSANNSLVVPDFGDGWGHYCSPKDQTLPHLTEFLAHFCETRAGDHNANVHSFLRAHAVWQRAEHGVPGHWALPFPDDADSAAASPPVQPP
eukprot:Hpha_TRINITY_DN16641_c2_g2::TRINITY_DN16641_c2_g2_i3::g.178380::m.178380